MEIDAASNNGVDNIRELNSHVGLVSMSSRCKVYILDEVHMLSSGAFNALLKTLEEPPPYVLFILATTETHKVPATILSRCQRFAFKRLNETDVAARLAEVALSERIELTDSAAKLLARLADGALRDALSLLDQCAGTPGTLDENAVREALGMADGDDIARLAAAIYSGDAAAALQTFRAQLDMGRDAAALLGELSQYVRDKLVEGLKTTPDRKWLDALTDVQDTLARLPRVPRPKIEAELCILKMSAVTPTAAPQIIAAPTAAPPVSAAIKELPPPVIVKPEAKPKLKPGDDSWNAVRAETSALLPPSLTAFLNRPEITLKRAEGLWQLVVTDEITRDRLSEPRVTDALSQVAAKHAGHPVSVRVALAEPEPVKPNAELQALLDNF
jgi:DNA polymerase III gamma/tau subunit